MNNRRRNRFKGIVGTSAAYLIVYSLRNLTGWSGDVVQVRRLSDNAEQWFGFNGSGVIDTTAIASFCSGSVGKAIKIKNIGNGGSAYDLVNTYGNIPNIYSGSAFYYINGIPAFYFDGSSRLYSDLVTSVLDQDSFSSTVYQSQPSGAIKGLWYERKFGDVTNIIGMNSVVVNRYDNLFYSPTGLGESIDRNSILDRSINECISHLKSGNNGDLYVNGIEQTDSSTTLSADFGGTNVYLDFGGRVSGALNHNNLIAELVIDSSADSVKLTSCISDQMTYFSL